MQIGADKFSTLFALYMVLSVGKFQACVRRGGVMVFDQEWNEMQWSLDSE